MGRGRVMVAPGFGAISGPLIFKDAGSRLPVEAPVAERPRRESQLTSTPRVIRFVFVRWCWLLALLALQSFSEFVVHALQPNRRPIADLAIFRMDLGFVRMGVISCHGMHLKPR